MPSRIRHITIDCRDAYSLARFWSSILGFTLHPTDRPGDPQALLSDPSGRHPGLLFIAVPEAKTVKNRVHLDLQPDDAREAAVDHAVATGASLVDDRRNADGTGWVVLADPEGNEFCIERSAAERGEPAPSVGDDQSFPEAIRTAGERELLTMMLDWYRAAVLRKVADISPETARTSPVRSATSIAGVLKHLALVEDSWFHDRFAGNGEPEPWASAPWDDDGDWEFHSAADDSVDDLAALYQAACERSRQAIGEHALDDVAAGSERPFNLRFALVHLIEETARHLGHMDIIREFLDGTTGE